MAKQTNWWETFFDDFRPAFKGALPSEARREARYVYRKLELKTGRTFLDCPCGFGRISLPLAKMGVKVTGVDITQSYLDEFDRKAHKAGVTVDLIHQDMRRIGFRNRFDAAANLYTSFGYFESDAQNRLVLKKVFEALRPGGRFMLSTINRDWIILNFASSNWEETGGLKMLQSRWMDYTRSIIHDEWHFLKDGVEKVHKTTIRLYSFHELRAMLDQIGFVDIEGYGSYDDQPTGRTNRNIYAIARKP
jgi:2-polyprenyl-3-methyl-5-hydroxy-6-metoxy-1,4-benzoquinol methylase